MTKCILFYYFIITVTYPLVPASGLKVAYEPVTAHWFYSTQTVAHGIVWWPFDLVDSQRLEAAAASANLLYVEHVPSDAPNATVPVRGGLYDVVLRDRVYKPVYWSADEMEAGEVRRVTWLYRYITVIFLQFGVNWEIGIPLLRMILAIVRVFVDFIVNS